MLSILIWLFTKGLGLNKFFQIQIRLLIFFQIQIQPVEIFKIQIRLAEIFQIQIQMQLPKIFQIQILIQIYRSKMKSRFGKLPDLVISPDLESSFVYK